MIEMSVVIKDREELMKLMTDIKMVEGVIDVERMIK